MRLDSKTAYKHKKPPSERSFGGALSLWDVEAPLLFFGEQYNRRIGRGDSRRNYFEILFNCYQMVMNEKENRAIMNTILEKQDDLYGINGA